MKQLLIIFLIWISNIASAQSIRINEFSQGASGAKEWVELVVSSTTPITYSNCVMARVNIAGWILDDNNGDFSPPNHFTGTGMATGHMRFKNEAPWNSLPVGAIIVIYNALDRDLILPADDPYDWVNNDCVYIVPSNHVSLEYCTTLPAASSCILRTDYTSCTYVSTGTWANIGLANAGDAIQVRDPSFNLVHGAVYGKSTSASGCTTAVDMVGNSLAPLISNVAMSGTSAAFIGTSDAEYFDATKWTIQAASLATPGTYNNAANQTYIVDTLRGGCTCNRILPLNIMPPLTADVKNIGPFKYKRIGEYVNFTTDINTGISIKLFTIDGRYVQGMQLRFRGTYNYRIPKGAYYLNITVEYRYTQDHTTLKVLNL